MPGKDIFRKALEMALDDMIKFSCIPAPNRVAEKMSCKELTSDLGRYMLERGVLVSVDEHNNLIKCTWSVIPGLPAGVQGAFNEGTIECMKMGRVPILAYHTHPENVAIHSAIDLFMLETWGWMCVGRNSDNKARIICFFVTPDNIEELARVSDQIKYLVGQYVEQRLCVVPVPMIAKLPDEWWIKMKRWINAKEDMETFKKIIIKEIQRMYKCLFGFPIAVFKEDDARAIEEVFIEYLDKMKREGMLPDYFVIEHPCPT